MLEVSLDKAKHNSQTYQVYALVWASWKYKVEATTAYAQIFSDNKGVWYLSSQPSLQASDWG